MKDDSLSLSEWFREVRRHPQWLGVFGAFVGTTLLYLQFAASDPDPVVREAATLTVTPASFTQTASLEEELSPFAPLSISEEEFASTGTATEGAEGLLRSLELMRIGCRHVNRIPDYSADFIRQERIDGVLKSPETIALKVRHHPFSIYLNWTEGEETGRELIYADGKNDNEMLFHAGGWKGRLLPPIKLNPRGSIAMRYARHPVTDLGLVGVGKKTIERREKEIEAGGPYRFQLDENSEYDGRPAIRCEIVFDRPNGNEIYRKAVWWIDRELLIPFAVINYGWPDDPSIAATDLDQETLLEDYAFTNVRLHCRLADLDFDSRNENYKFRR